MARRSQKPSNSAVIKKLLQERATLTQWLERLSDASDTPEKVREKVQGDYTRRLNEVSKQLQGFTKQLRDSLDEQKRKHIELYDREAEAEGRLTEAKLRHSVGEFDDDRWDETKAELEADLESAREEMKGVDQELTRLEEVLSTIDEGAEAADDEPAEDEEEEEDEESADDAAESEAPAAKPAPTGAKRKTASRSTGRKSFDELEFLKSLRDRKSKKSARPAGAKFKPAAGRAKAGSQDQAQQGASRKNSPSQNMTVKKSLKCAECGTLNIPTEWYCENCGAELAVV